MFLDLLEQVYFGIVNTAEAQKALHRHLTQIGLNPAVDEPLSQLMLYQKGRDRLTHYETFMNHVNWLLAAVAAKEVAVEHAQSSLESEMQKLM